MMARYIIRERLERPEQLLAFDAAGYGYCPEVSTPERPVFRRPEHHA